MDGLRVPLIVYDKDDPYDYDEDETISLSGLFDCTSIMHSKFSKVYYD